MLLLPLSVLSDRKTQFFLYKKYHKHDNDAQKIHIVKQKIALLHKQAQKLVQVDALEILCNTL